MKLRVAIIVPRNRTRQRGATLVIALVILLVMSLIGVSNMQSSTLQERMAANNRQKTVALYAAESALNIAEKWVENHVSSAADLSLFNGSNGLYSKVNLPSGVAAVPASTAISNVTLADNWHTFGVSTTAVDRGLVAQQPRYFIEYIGRDFGAANKQVSEINSDTRGRGRMDPHLFRVVAIGWSKDDTIYTVLEAVIRTGNGDSFSY